MPTSQGHQELLGALGAANPGEARSGIATGQQILEQLLNHRPPTAEGSLEEFIVAADEALCPVLDELV